jgi:hypothetical protein
MYSLIKRANDINRVRSIMHNPYYEHPAFKFIKSLYNP